MGKRKTHEVSSDEDSDTAVRQSHKKSKHAKKARLNDSSQSNEKRTKEISNALLSVQDLDPDDEIWLLKVPSHVNVDHLHDQVLPFTNDSAQKLSLGENLQYATRVEKKKAKLPVLLPDSQGQIKAVSLACKGEITLVEHVEVPSVGEIKVPPKSYVKQPKGFVRRHPFFGVEPPPPPPSSQGGDGCNLDDSATNLPVEDVTENLTKKEKKAKKKKKSKK